MKPASFLAWAVLPVLGLVIAPRTARADDILVYAKFDTLSPALSGNEAQAEAKEILEGLGHNVTVVASLTPVLPADLSLFDTIWVIQLPPISGLDQTKLREFVRAGGGLYLTGDNHGCCQGVNSSIDSFFSGLLLPPMPQFTGQLNTAAVLFPTAANPFGLTTTPNTITQWETDAGSSIGLLDPARQVFKDASSKVGAAAFVGEDMEKAAGCVYVAMDLSFWLDVAAPTQNLTPLTENVEHFLEGCADADHDGVSDSGEPGFGTDPADPDSDDDGLCDGFGNVPGVCVAGESVYDDFDDDNVINPLDADDDGDGLSTKFELAAEAAAPNADGDNIPAQYDLDSDANFILDGVEGTGDYDNDGIPAIVDDGDEPPECAVEADCGAGSGLYCNLEVGYCNPGCFAGGNGCPTGETCTSTDETIGQCSTGGTGGAGGTGGTGGGAPGGSGGSGASSNGGTGAGSGGGAGTSGAGGAKAASSGDDGGCGCGTVGADERSGPIGAALLAALTMLLRRRRTTADR